MDGGSSNGSSTNSDHRISEMRQFVNRIRPRSLRLSVSPISTYILSASFRISGIGARISTACALLPHKPLFTDCLRPFIILVYASQIKAHSTFHSLTHLLMWVIRDLSFSDTFSPIAGSRSLSINGIP